MHKVNGITMEIQPEMAQFIRTSESLELKQQDRFIVDRVIGEMMKTIKEQADKLAKSSGVDD